MAQYEITSNGRVTKITVEESDVNIVIPKVINNIEVREVYGDLICDKSIDSITVEDNIQLQNFQITWRPNSSSYTINKISVFTIRTYVYCYYGRVNLLEQFSEDDYINMYAKGVQNFSFPTFNDPYGSLYLTFNSLDNTKPVNISFPLIVEKSTVVRKVSQEITYGSLEKFLKNVTITTKEGTSPLPPSIEVRFESGYNGDKTYLYGENESLPVLESTPTRIFKGWVGEFNRAKVYKNSSELFDPRFNYSVRIYLYPDYDDICTGGGEEKDLPFIEHHPEETGIHLAQEVREALINIHNKFAMFR